MGCSGILTKDFNEMALIEEAGVLRDLGNGVPAVF
jgi:hypothetical protein